MRRQDGGAGRGARARVSQARSREALGNRPGSLRSSALNGWTQVWTKARRKLAGKRGRSPVPHPEARSRGQKNAAVARREAPRVRQ